MSLTTFARAGFAALALTLAAGTSSVLAFQPEGKEAPVAVETKNDPKATAVMEKMAEFYKGLKQFSGEVKSQMNMGAEDQKSGSTFVVAKPNKIAIKPTEKGDGPMTPGQIVSDGTSLYVTGGMLDQSKKYIKKDAPESASDMQGDMDIMMGMGMNGAGMFPLMLTSEEGLNNLTDEVGALTLAGTEMVNGVECHKITFKAPEGEEGSGSFLVQTGDKPWLHRLTFEAQAPMGSMKMNVDFSQWSDGAPAADAFAFKAPEGYEAVASMRDAMPEMPGMDAHEEAHESIGKAAPAIKLPYITGGTGEIDIAKHKGKEVVLVDFWATWCGPCVKGLPTVSKVAAAFKDKGVAFYAVDLREDPSEVIEFMKKKKWDFTALSDIEGSVSDAFGITGIPHTVIIDKEGVVRQVHIGLIPNLEKQLTKELEAVLAGKDPRAEEKKDAKDEGKGKEDMGG